MRVKIILNVLLVFFCFTARAQAPDISGIYSSLSHSPEGSPTLYVFKDGFYAIPYFGGVQFGTWEIENNTQVVFRPEHVKERFAVYARYNPQLQGSTRVFFSGFEHGENYFGIRTLGQASPNLNRVFNEDANCTSWPFVSLFPRTQAQSLLMQSKPRDDTETPQAFEFIPKDGDNDFVVQHFKSDRDNQPFYIEMRGGKLQLEMRGFSSQANKKRLAKLSEEDKKFLQLLRKQVGKGLPQQLLFNPSYKQFIDGQEDVFGEASRINLSKYHFDLELNAYVLKSVENRQTLADSSDSVHDKRIIYAFERLQKGSLIKSKLDIISSPTLFHLECEKP